MYVHKDQTYNLSVTSALHLKVNLLYLHSWRCFLIVYFDNHTPTYQECSWLGLFLTDVLDLTCSFRHFGVVGFTCVFLLLNNVPNQIWPLLNFLLSLIACYDGNDWYVLFNQPNVGLLNLHWHLFGPHIDSC